MTTTKSPAAALLPRAGEFDYRNAPNFETACLSGPGRQFRARPAAKAAATTRATPSKAAIRAREARLKGEHARQRKGSPEPPEELSLRWRQRSLLEDLRRAKARRFR